MRFLTLCTSAALAATSVTAFAQQPGTVPALQASTAQPVSLDRIAAVVGDVVITQSTLQERVIQKRAEGVQIPRDSVSFKAFLTTVLNEIVDEELLLLKAKELKVEVPDADVNSTVDKQSKDIRKRFGTESEFRSELMKAGYGTPEEYKRFLADGIRRTETITRTTRKLKEDGKIAQVNVTDGELADSYARNKAVLPQREDGLTWRQIIITPKPSAANKEISRVKAESLLAQIKAGEAFERVAKRESKDSASAAQGGDLGWNRRGKMVAEFDRWMFALQPGQMSPVVETVYGYHIIKVDRVNLAEVKASHILIAPTIDSADVARAKVEADSVGAQLAAGTPFDTLAKKHHDFKSGEETIILTPYPREKLPPEYQTAFAGKKAKDVVVFQIQGNPLVPAKFVAAQVASTVEGGELTLEEFKVRFRQRLAEEGGVKRLMDGLRKATYVSIRNDALNLAPPPGAP